MRRTPLPLPASSNPAIGSVERLVNCYAKVVGVGQSARVELRGSPGLRTWCATPGLPCRGMIDTSTVLISVHGASVFAMDTAGVATLWGAIPNDGKPVVMATNGAVPQQTAIVTGGQVYVASGGSVSLLSDPDLPGNVVSVIWVDGYFIFAIADGRFFISGLNSTSVNALDFATAEADPDGLVAVATIQREVYFFGKKTTEIWTNTGAASFPFERLQGGAMPFGLASPYAVAQVEQSLYWLDDGGAVRRTTGGYATEVIGNESVEIAVRAVADKTEIVAFAYRYANETFFVLRHPTFTWLYNTATGFWHERKSKNVEEWRINAIRFFGGKIIAGSRLDGSLFEISPDAYDEAGEELIYTIQPPRVESATGGACFEALEIEMDTGLGRELGPEPDTIDPQMSLYWSDDGGKVWNGGRTLSLGRQGNYSKMVKTTRLGSTRGKGRVWRFTSSSRVALRMIGASMQVSPRET